MNVKSLKDEELVLLLKSCGEGKAAALEGLYRKVAPILNGYALGIVRCEALSNEVLQDSIIHIWEKAVTYEPERGKAMSWMYAIVRSRAIDKIRVERKHRRDDFAYNEKALTEVPAVIECQPETVLSYSQAIGSLEHNIEKLPFNHRRTMRLAYFYGYSRIELAEALETNVNTIKSWLRRGVNRLKQYEDNANVMP